MASRLSKADKVLVAFYRVAGNATKKISYEEVVIQAWKDFPGDFSLRNHPEYPDASDIHKALYKPLKPRGLVVAIGNKTFRLTDKGVDEAKILIGELDGLAASKKGSSRQLSRDDETFIRQGLQSRAYQVWLRGAADELIDYDARLFFRFSTATSMEQRKLKVNAAMESIRKAQTANVNGAGELHALAAHLIRTFPDLLQKEQQQ